jgi:hypothetical protein
MRPSNLHNRRLVALLSLMAMVLFAVAFNVHTDDHGFNLPYASGIGDILSGQIRQHISSSPESHCVACELMALGAGNTMISPAIHVATVHAQEPIPVTPNPIICCDIHQTGSGLHATTRSQ